MKYRELIDNYKQYVGSDYDIELEGIEYIIQETNSLSRSNLILSLDKEVINLDELKRLLDDYCINHIPAQYVIGYAYFYGLKFNVNKNVLIPRFDTEVLVDEVIDYLKNKDGIYKCVDIGTGSGAIAIAVKSVLGDKISMDAVDISPLALEVAKENAKMNNFKVDFINDDLLLNNTSLYDVIISNPPYIDFDDDTEGVSKMVNEFEPHLALYSQDKGLYHYKKIIDQSLDRLKSDGVIFFEIPDNKCDYIVDYAKQYYNDIKIIEDYHHLRRVLKIGARK